METNGDTLPVRKIDRSAWGNDMMAVEVPASDVIAGDMVEGLGIVGAAFVTRNHAGSIVILLCSGENAVTKFWGEQVVVCGAICPECDMHPDDCWEWGCGWGPLDDACHCGQPVTYGYDGNPLHTRGMCEDCDTVRCDANPGACR